MRQDNRAPFDRALHGARVSAYAPGEFVGQESFMAAAEIRALAAQAGVGPGVTVLDLCCGTAGPGRLLAQELGCDYLGVDASASAVAIARQRARALPCRFAIAQVPPLRVGSFDVVLLLETMLAFEDKDALVREIAATLRPGGRFAFTLEEGSPLTTAERAAMPDADTVWLTRLDEMGTSLERAGLDVTWQEDHSRAHGAMAQALAGAFAADAGNIAAHIGRRALDELLAAHRLWVEWLDAGRVRKLALVAERTVRDSTVVTLSAPPLASTRRRDPGERHVGELGGFLKITRTPAPERDPRARVADYKEIYEVLPEADAARQGARCMECGVPFCHDGCPLGNLIPDWNDLVYQGRWREAIDQLHATNNFPEWTGLICPAPCEPACVLSINDDPVSIKQIELAIVERAWEEGWIVPSPPDSRSGHSVGIIGSGPAGLAAAAQLNRAGHDVVIYERDEGPGGLLRFGVPDFKLEKHYIDRRVAVLEAEGVRLSYGADVGVDVSAAELRERHDAVVLAIGSRVHRTLDVPGAGLAGVRFAMDYLYARNRWVARGDAEGDDPELTAAGKHVVVIGGGDTAMDCVGNATRERAKSVTVLDTYPAPPGPAARDSVPWPQAPRRLVSTYALEEGGERRWTQTATRLDDRDGHVVAVHGTYVTPPPGPEPVPGTEFALPADLVLIAIGFSHPEHTGVVEQFALELDRRGNVKAPTYATSYSGVFAAGDARIGQSLIVNAIAEGRRCARVVDRHLAAVAVR